MTLVYPSARHELVETTARVVDLPGQPSVPVMHCAACGGIWRLDEPNADAQLLRDSPCPGKNASLLDLHG